jgi:hypothetical protein
MMGLASSLSVLALLFVGATAPAPAFGWCGDGAAATPCIGDCDGLGSVTVDELVAIVNEALVGGTACANADGNSDRVIDVPEIVEAINNALNGCRSAGLDSAEECDDGGFCVGGADAGEACTSEGHCEGDGACFGGLDDLRGCSSDDDCRGGACRRCRPYGGDGCAANCTFETDHVYALVPGEVAHDGNIVFGTSGTHLFGPFLYVPMPMTGSQVLTSGKIVDRRAAVVVKAASIDFDEIPVSTIACACVRGATASTCGGTLFDRDGTESANCTPGFAGVIECPADKRCAAVHGPGNTGSGFVTCGGSNIAIDVTQDCNGAPGDDPFDPVETVTASAIPLAADQGAGHLVITAAIGTVVGMCRGDTPEYGPDGAFCTGDDPAENRGTPNSIRLTTGAAQAVVLNPGDFEGDILGPFPTTGAPFSCGGDEIGVHGANLAGAFTDCDQPTISDIAAPVNFAAE